jgi:hypothetical protein
MAAKTDHADDFDVDQVLKSGHSLARAEILANINLHHSDWKDLSYYLFSVLVEISDSTHIIQTGEEKYKRHKPENLYDSIGGETRKIFDVWSKTEIPKNQDIKRLSSRYDASSGRGSRKTEMKFTSAMYSYIGAVKYNIGSIVSEQEAFSEEVQKNYLESVQLASLASDYAQIAHLMLIIKDELNIVSHDNSSQGTLAEGLVNILLPPRIFQLATQVVKGVDSLLMSFSEIFGSTESFKKSEQDMRADCGKISVITERLVCVYRNSQRLPDAIGRAIGSGSAAQAGLQADSEASMVTPQEKHEEIRELIGNLVVLISRNADEHTRRLDSSIDAIRKDFGEALAESSKTLQELSSGQGLSHVSKNRISKPKDTASMQSGSNFEADVYVADADGHIVSGISANKAIDMLNDLKHEILRAARSQFSRSLVELPGGKSAARFRPIELYHCIIYEGLSREMIKNSITDVASPSAKELFRRMVISRNPSYQDVVDWQIAQFGKKINEILKAIVSVPEPLYDDEEVEF